MRYFLCLVALLPCLLAAEVKTIFCPGGKECPFGKTCCETSNGEFECCDVPEEDLLNKKLVSALPPISAMNESLALSQTQRAICYGTSCPYGMCCENNFNAVCCPYRAGHPTYCCPGGTRCCSNSYTSVAQPWCCRYNQRCHTSYGYCLAGASTLKVALLPLLLAFAMGAVSKYVF